MRTKKDRVNEVLFDAVGKIDDRLIQEAQSPDRAIASMRAKRRFLQSGAIAACIALALTGGGMFYAITNKPHTEPSDGTPSVSAPSYTQAEESQTLFEMLSDTQGSKLVSTKSPDTLDFYDGNMSLIWRERGADSVQVMKVSEKNQAAISKGIESAGAVSLTAEQAEAQEYEIWVCMGDGRVLSPQLKYSNGNIGHAELFEYLAEQEPSEQFTKAVYNLINPS